MNGKRYALRAPSSAKAKAAGFRTFTPTEVEQMSQQELHDTYTERYSSGDLSADEMAAA
jgi:hypothetical protein